MVGDLSLVICRLSFVTKKRGLNLTSVEDGPEK
jgi:hypothetical protein